MAASSSTGGALSSFSTAGTVARPFGHRASWRHKDSSEKTPSTVDSDSAYIAPAVPVIGPTPSALLLHIVTTNSTPFCEQSLERVASETLRSNSLPSTASGLTDQYDLRHVLPWIQVGQTRSDGADVEHILGPTRRDSDQSASLISPQSPTVAGDRRQNHRNDDRDYCASSDQIDAHPTFLPLQPHYRPPKRRPTPPGVPSFEASQRNFESRMALRRFGLGPAVGGGRTAQNSTSSSGTRPFSGLSL